MSSYKYGRRMVGGSYTYASKSNNTDKTKKNNIVSFKAQKGGQTLFLKTKADIAIYGGAAGGGKTYALLIDLIRKHKVSNDKYRATIFRREATQITNTGGLLDESKKIYPKLDGKLTVSPAVDWNFTSGARISFRAIQHEKDLEKYQGAQMCDLRFDELTHFTENQFFYMLSRNRTDCGIKTTCKATCNPDADSWVADFIDWWIDPDSGLPIKERRGKIRYMIRHDEQCYWSSNKEKLEEKFRMYPDDHPQAIYNPKAKSVTFIYATIEDNLKLLEADPNYISNLNALHPIEKARLLYGNWKIKIGGGKIYDKEWFKIIKTLPDFASKGFTVVRFWDFAATSKDTAKTKSQYDNSYYTACVKLVKYDKRFFIVDARWKRIKGGDIFDWVKQVAEEDGDDCLIRWELEGGSSGKTVAQNYKQDLVAINPSYNAKAVKPYGDKVTRAIKAATAASNGLVYVHMIDSKERNTFLDALQKFDGSRQPLSNDLSDAFSGAYNEIYKRGVYTFNDECITSVNTRTQEENPYHQNYSQDNFDQSYQHSFSTSGKRRKSRYQQHNDSMIWS